jgi:hypothetical protein
MDAALIAFAFAFGLAAQQIRLPPLVGFLVATGKFDDEVRQLRHLGVDTAFNLYSEAGAGFAAHVFNVFNQQRPDLVGRWKGKEEE